MTKAQTYRDGQRSSWQQNSNAGILFLRVCAETFWWNLIKDWGIITLAETLLDELNSSYMSLQEEEKEEAEEDE